MVNFKTDARALYVGDTPAQAVYLGTDVIWTAAPPFDPASALSGLVVWHDSADYTPGVWPNKAAGGAQPAFLGTPPPQLSPETKNGQSVVRFKANEGRLRGTCPGVTTDHTVVYATRLWGPNVGRSFTVVYPGTSACNYLVGFHSSGIDWMYDNGAVNNATPWPAAPSPWRLYSSDMRSAPSKATRFFINGVQSGIDFPTGIGLGGTYNLSGYDATGAQETMDCEVAELLVYNRRLDDAERHQVETYLRTKWAL